MGKNIGKPRSKSKAEAVYFYYFCCCCSFNLIMRLIIEERLAQNALLKIKMIQNPPDNNIHVVYYKSTHG